MPHILVAEDDNALRQNIVEILALEGFDVTQVASAEEAIAASEKQSFALALVDLVMSGMTGVDAIAHLHQLQPKLPVVIITAYATVDTAVDAMKKGADGVITKPFNADELVITIKRTLAEKQASTPKVEFNPDLVYSALANPFRRQALKNLDEHQSLKFMDLCRLSGIEDHTKFNFHLRQLKLAGLVTQNESKLYILTTTGQYVLQHHSLN